jgi:cysteine-rich repeat protein
MLDTTHSHSQVRKTLLGALAALVALIPSATAFAAPFTPGNVAVYRVGDGAAGLVNTGAPVFIDEFTPIGAFVQSVALPTAASAPNNALIASGTATSEGMLTRSLDKRALVLTGYNRALGGSGSLSNTTGATVPRTVAWVDYTGGIDTTTALIDFSDGNNPRSAAAIDGSTFWVTGGAGGLRSAALGATTSTQLSTTVTNLRQVSLFGSSNDVFVSSSSGSVIRIGKLTGATLVNEPGIPSTGTSPYSFFMADLDAAVAGDDVMYVALDDAGALTKYSLVAGTWVTNGVVGSDQDYRGLTGVVTGGLVTLYSTRLGGSAAAGGGQLVSLVDSSGYNGAFAGTPTLLATAAPNTAFRGVALAPEGAPVIVCGDGVVQAGEQCDDGNLVNGDGCNVTCVIELCGDGLVQAGLGEQCDDGNSVNGDGCSTLCTSEVCGDAVVQPNLGEQCDDGNVVNGDGCNSTCRTELPAKVPAVPVGALVALALGLASVGARSSRKNK